jgi:hypothetical protein
MPKIRHQPPKYCKVKVRKKLYAAVYLNGKTIYLGAYGSQASKIAYARFVAEFRATTSLYLPDAATVTVRELALSFLEHVEGTITPQSFGHNRSAIRALLKLYGDNTPVGRFTPRCLNLYRQELIKSKCLCRKMVNNHVGRIVSMFTWGVGEELVQPQTEHVQNIENRRNVTALAGKTFSRIEFVKITSQVFYFENLTMNQIVYFNQTTSFEIEFHRQGSKLIRHTVCRF